MDDRSFLAPWAPQLLALLRIVSGLLFLEHGTAKFFGFPPFMEIVPLFSLYGAAGVLELVGGALIIAGLFTRPVAFVLSGEMAFAYFLDHLELGFFPVLNQGEAAILFCFVFLYFAAAGPGAWSVDGTLMRATPRS